MGSFKNYLSILLMVLLFIYCSDDKSTNPAEEEDEFPEFQINFVDIETPQKVLEASEQGDLPAMLAMTAIETMQMVKEFGSEGYMSGVFGGQLANLNYLGKPSSPETKYNKSYTTNGVTINIFQEITPIMINGEVTLNGTLEGSSITFNNWTQSEIFSTLGTFDGFFNVYELNTNTEAMSVEWEQENSEYVTIYYAFRGIGPLPSISGTWHYYLENKMMVGQIEYLDGTHYDIKIYADGTGEYTHWSSDSQILYEGTWD